MRRVVITGMGAVTPLGVGARALFAGWAAGDCAIESGVARCAGFGPAAGSPPRHVRFALAAAEEAVAEAGWQHRLPYDPERIACAVGTGVGTLALTEAAASVRADADRVSSLALALTQPYDAATALSLHFGLRGAALPLVSACAAGAHAIGEAGRMVAAGDADAVLAVGTEASISPLPLAAFAAMGAMSRVGVSRPFDVRRDGFVMGEGAGALVLEEAAAAAARGAVVLAELAGYGFSDDAYHITAPEPDGAGAARAIELALAGAGVSPGRLAYVNAHGTSTQLNDRCETVGLKRALGADVARRVPVSSTKSAIGHLIGAAGAVEAIATVHALRERSAPPTLGYEEPDPELDLDFIPSGPRPLPSPNGTPLAALSNSFGFGGHNVVLCLTTPAKEASR
jgi:3-oxoacyl-[acyl-carrier-protein] synthase II